MQTQTIGALPQNAKTEVMYGEYNDTPYFSPGMEADSAHMLAMPVGTQLAGILRDTRTSKNEDKRAVRNYLCMEDFNGNKFRVQAPAQLWAICTKLPIDSAIALTYEGMKVIDGVYNGDPVHQFKVERVVLTQ